MIGMTLMALMPILRLVGTRLTLAARAGLPIRAGAEFRSGIRRLHWVYWSSSTLHISYLVGLWLMERISHLSTRRRIMATKKIRLILAALLGLSGVLPAAATDNEAADYLPLAVGNSWTYEHLYHDYNAVGGGIIEYSAYYDQWPGLYDPVLYPELTIEVLNTEVIDGKTYYVISDMPANWPPAPPHFIAGKKLRWEGSRLMERTADGEQAIFRFDGTPADYIPTNFRFEGLLNFRLEKSKGYQTGYAIPTTQGDNRVEVEAGLKPVPWYMFEFHGNNLGWRVCGFLAGYGSNACIWVIAGKGVVFINRLIPLRAVIGGTSVEFADALIPTSTSSSSWGQVKQSWLAGERRDQ